MKKELKIGKKMLASTIAHSHAHHAGGECDCKHLPAFRSSLSIWTAAHYGDKGRVAQIIAERHYSAAAAVDAHGHAALLYAARENNVDIVRMLLQHGCPPDAGYGAGGVSPLHRAAFAGSVESCHELVRAGADLSIVDTSISPHRTPLAKAASQGHAEIVSFLLKEGASATCLDSHGSTVMHAAAENGHTSVINAIITFLSAQAADGSSLAAMLSTRSEATGETALLSACRNGHSVAAALLLYHGANIDVTDNSGLDAVDITSTHPNAESVMIVLSRYGSSKAKEMISKGSSRISRERSLKQALHDEEITLRPTGNSHSIETTGQRQSRQKPNRAATRRILVARPSGRPVSKVSGLFTVQSGRPKPEKQRTTSTP